MSIISKEAAQRHLDMWLEAEAAVSTGQSYQIEQMMLTRASLKQIRESIIFWEKKVAAVSYTHLTLPTILLV